MMSASARNARDKNIRAPSNTMESKIIAMRMTRADRQRHVVRTGVAAGPRFSATAEVLETISTKLDWTKKLGDTVLAQQPDVMDAVQRLHARADANNKLR